MRGQIVRVLLDVVFGFGARLRQPVHLAVEIRQLIHHDRRLRIGRDGRLVGVNGLVDVVAAVDLFCRQIRVQMSQCVVVVRRAVIFRRCGVLPPTHHTDRQQKSCLFEDSLHDPICSRFLALRFAPLCNSSIRATMGDGCIHF